MIRSQIPGTCVGDFCWRERVQKVQGSEGSSSKGSRFKRFNGYPVDLTTKAYSGQVVIIFWSQPKFPEHHPCVALLYHCANSSSLKNTNVNRLAEQPQTLNIKRQTSS